MMDQTRSGGSPQPSDRLDHNRFVGRTRVAYFSMEIAISPEMPTYSGGLGILAGDTARAAADLDLPMVFVTLVSRAGYLRQELDATGHQTDAPDPWDPARWACPLPAMVAVPIAEAAMLAWSGGFRSLESRATLPELPPNAAGDQRARLSPSNPIRMSSVGLRMCWTCAAKSRVCPTHCRADIPRQPTQTARRVDSGRLIDRLA